MVETVVTVERTQTTQTASPPVGGGGGGLSALTINIGYFTTVPGIIKLVQFVLGIICMAFAAPAYIGATSFFLFVAVIAFIATLFWIPAHLFGLRERMNETMNWILPEFLNTGINALLYFIAFIVQLASWSTIKEDICILGIICMACASPAYIGATSFFLFAVVIAFIATLLWIIIYLLGVREALTVPINWMFAEFANTGVNGLLYFIAFIVQLASWSGRDAYILGIICMACASPAYIGATSFFLFVVVVAFIATLLWIFAYLLGIREALNVAVNWIFTELINTGIASILYFIAFVVQLAKWSSLPFAYAYGSNIAAGVFGLFNFLAYAAGTYFLYLEYKSGAIR